VRIAELLVVVPVREEGENVVETPAGAPSNERETVPS
jgi:hypothetical protein